jgi:CTP-dependent riboflavin kinase
MNTPKSWRPFLTAVQNSEPARRSALGAKFSSRLIDTAANCGLISVSDNGKWITLTDRGAEVLHACNVKLKRLAAAEQALSLLADIREVLKEAANQPELVAKRVAISQFLSEMEWR